MRRRPARRRVARVLATAFALVAASAGAPPAEGAPIARSARLSLQLAIPGVGFSQQAGGPRYPPDTTPIGVIDVGAAVSVDPVAQSISLAPEVVAQTAPITLPIDSTTGLQALSLSGLANHSGRFGVGGARGIAGEPPCPALGPAACIAQSGFGGEMKLSGTLDLVLVKDRVTIPLALGALGFGGGGSPGPGATFSFDAAPWTVLTASIADSGSSRVRLAGSITESGFSLVAPTYVRALGAEIPVFAVLDVRFDDGRGVPGFVGQRLPGPGTLVCLAGALALSAIARRRASRR